MAVVDGAGNVEVPVTSGAVVVVVVDVVVDSGTKGAPLIIENVIVACVAVDGSASAGFRT